MKISEQIKTSKSDEYYTPAYAVQVILPFLKDRGFKHIWCPFDKELSEVKEFKNTMLSKLFVTDN